MDLVERYNNELLGRKFNVNGKHDIYTFGEIKNELAIIYWYFNDHGFSSTCTFTLRQVFSMIDYKQWVITKLEQRKFKIKKLLNI